MICFAIHFILFLAEESIAVPEALYFLTLIYDIRSYFEKLQLVYSLIKQTVPATQFSFQSADALQINYPMKQICDWKEWGYQ